MSSQYYSLVQTPPTSGSIPSMQRSTKIKILNGALIPENAAYGESLWSWLGGETFEEFTLSGISYPLRMSFVGDPQATIWRLPRHLFLFWKRGYYKSTMIGKFLELLQPHWPTHSIGVATAESMRGSVSGRGSNYVFHPPGILLGNIVAIPEFQNITTINGVIPVLLDWWGTGDISVDLVKISTALQNQVVQNQMKNYDIEILDGRYRFHTDSVGLAASHTDTDKLRKFPPAVYDRLLVLHHEPEVLTTGLARDVAMRAKNASQNTSVLREMWRFYGDMQVEGNLPDIPDDWIKELDVEPRLISNYASTVYSHAFIMQPKRHGLLNPTYPELILEDEDHRFALDRIGVYKRGQEAILGNLKGTSRRNITQELIAFVNQRGSITTKEAALEFGRGKRRIRQILSGLEGTEVRKSGSSGPNVTWHPI